jgi:hypothetical protein
LANSVGIALAAIMCLEQILLVAAMQRELLQHPVTMCEFSLVVAAVIESFALKRASVIALLRLPRVVIHLTQKYSKIR